MNQEKIGNFIAQCRKEQNLTQLQLAEKLNMSDKSISKWETGKGMPDSSVMLDLCKYLGITVNELLSGEKLDDTQYFDKANENILSMTKEAERNKKLKNRIIIICIIIFISILIGILLLGIYKNSYINIDYDDRLIQCEIIDNKLICSFNGSSLVHFDSCEINNNEETLIFITGKILLENKIHSHFETWDSMAQLNSGNETHFKSSRTIDIINNKENVKVYYTNISFNKITNANQEELQAIIEQSQLIQAK